MNKNAQESFKAVENLLDLLFPLLGGEKGPVWEQEEDEDNIIPFLERRGINYGED